MDHGVESRRLRKHAKAPGLDRFVLEALLHSVPDLLVALCAVKRL